MTDLFLDGGNASSTFDQATPAEPAPVFAPDIATYATRAPYVTPAEFTAGGTGVDVGQLVPGSNDPDVQAAALARAIARASSWADTYCRKILAATEDLDAGYFRVHHGVCRVPVRYTPVLEVVSLATGPAAWSLTPMTDLSRVAIVSPKVVEFAPAGLCPVDGRLFVQLGYVNGWTCTTLAAAAAFGDTQVSLGSNLGVYPGQLLTVDDGASTEQVTVDAAYVPGADGPVTLTAPLQYAHAVGAAFTAIPEAIKQAVILLTAAVIKTRGDEAFVMQSVGSEPEQVTATQSGGTRDTQLAYEMLAPYRRAR